MRRYHLTDLGPAPCDAKDAQSCPYETFDTRKEAQARYEVKMDAISPQRTLKKRSKTNKNISDDLNLAPDELIDYANSNQMNYSRVNKIIDERIKLTSQKLKEISKLENNGKTDKTTIRGLRRELNRYRDRTANYVEASTESKFYSPKWKTLEDENSIGNCFLVESFHPNSRKWLESRKNTVGGSDVSALVEYDFVPEDKRTFFIRNGLERCEQSKTKPLTDEQYSKSLHLSSGGYGALYRGSVWEDRIRDKYAEDYPDETVFNAKGQYMNNDHQWQKANFDGLLARSGEESPSGVLELKTSSVPEKWDNGIPIGYRAQTLYYLHTTGLSWARVRVCINDHEYKDFDLKANDPVVPGSKITMDEYVNKRVKPWFESLQKQRDE